MSTKNNKKRGITRRDFIKWSAAAGAAAKAVDWTKVGPAIAHPNVANTHRNICPYCSISCGVKVDVDSSDNIIDIYGDEDNVISRGSLCSKGSALYQLVDPTGAVGARVTEPRIKIGDSTDTVNGGTWYKHTGGGESGWLDIFGLANWDSTTYADDLDLGNWEEVETGNSPASGSLIETLPKKMADARVDYSGNNLGPDTVAFWGSSHQTNEECYLYRKLLTLFGTNNIEHQARI